MTSFVRIFWCPRTWLWLLTSAGISLSLSGQVPDIRATMPEAALPGLKPILEAAAKQSPTMLARNTDLAQAEASLYQANSVYWPQLNGGAGYSYNNSRSVVDGRAGEPSASTGISYNIGLGQNLFQWGAIKAGVDMTKISQKVTQRYYAEAYRTLSLSVRSQYLTLILKKATLQNSHRQLELQQRDLSQLEQKLKEGDLAEADIISPRLAYQEYALTVERADDDYQNGKRVLMRLTGLPELDESSIPAEIPKPIFDAATSDTLLTRFKQQGAQNTLTGQTYVLAMKQQDLSYKIAKTRLLPRFSLGAGYGVSNGQSVLDGGVDAAGNRLPGVVTQSFVQSYNYSLNTGWTIFDGFATRGAKLSALAGKRAAERTLQTYIDTTLDTVDTMRKQLAFIARSLELSEVRRALAEDQLKRTKVEFSEGTLSQSMVDAVTTNLASANNAVLSVRIEYYNRWTEYVSTLGFDPVMEAMPARYLSLDHGK